MLGFRQVEGESHLFTNDNAIFPLFHVDDILLVSRKDYAEQALAIRKALFVICEMKRPRGSSIGSSVFGDKGTGRKGSCGSVKSHTSRRSHKYNLQFRKHPATAEAH